MFKKQRIVHDTMVKFVAVLLLLVTGSAQLVAQTYPMGILPGEDELYDQIDQKAPLTRGFYEGAPSYYSLKQFAPIPKSQGPFGTCTGWAVAYASRTIIEAQKNGWTDKAMITANAFSPTFQFRQVKEDENCRGAYTSRVVSSMYSIGSVPMDDFYLSSGTELCPTYPVHSSNLAKASLNKIEDYSTLFTSEVSSDIRIYRVKSSISEGNPVVISMICPRSFHSIGPDGLWNPTESPDQSVDGVPHGRHALCVVGYDDTKHGGVFEIQNSWGSDWGNGGYCFVKYEDFGAFVYQAFEVVKFEPPKPKEPLLAGNLRLFDLDDNEDLSVSLASATRNWNVKENSNEDEELYTYKVNTNLRSGSEMRMYIRSEQSAYVYMLGTGEVDKSVAQLFPVDGISPALNYLGSEVALPSEDHFFKMDNTEGKNYIVLIFSKEKVDIDRIKTKFSNSYGTVSNKLKKATEGLLIDDDYIDFTSNEIAFEVEQNDSGKNTFAMIIQFNQGD